MGPTNVALVKLFQADMKLREAQAKLDSASRDIRIQERRVVDLNEKQAAAQKALRESQTQSAGLDLDLKSRDAHIERLRTQQQTTHNSREYQAFLLEINTQKVERTKVEEQTLAAMEIVETQQAELATLSASATAEQAKLTEMKAASEAKLKSLQGEVDAHKPARQAAFDATPAKLREPFERLANRFEGEALSALTKPDRRREEYACSSCNMDLVVDVYNKLHSRDEVIFCPSCKRILYIPDDLPPEMAIGTGPKPEKKAAKEPKAAKDGVAREPRQPRAPKAKKAKPIKMTVQQAIEKFLAWYPAGFQTPAYLDKHRVPRADAAQAWEAELGGGKAEQLLAEGAVGELIRKSDVVIGELTYLNRTERVALRESLNEEGSVREIFGALLPLIAESKPTAATFANYAATLKALPARGDKVGAWSPLTLLPALARPDRLMYVRADATAAAAARAGISDLDLNASPSWPAYEKVLSLAETALSQLRPHGAQDRLDVWAFFAIVSEYDAAPAKEAAAEEAPVKETPAAESSAADSSGEETASASAPVADEPAALVSSENTNVAIPPPSNAEAADSEESEVTEDVASR